MNKMIHYCWFGGNPLSAVAKKSLASWRKFAPDFEIMRWDESNFDVRSCKWAEEAYRSKKYAYVSDYARFKIIHEYGGVYMDVGSQLIRDISPLMGNLPFVGIEELTKTASPGLVLASEPLDFVVDAVLHIYQESTFIDEPDFLKSHTVNEIFTTQLERYGFQRIDEEQHVAGWTALRSSVFNPRYGLGGYHIKRDTVSVHHSSGSWTDPQMKFSKRLVWRLSPFIGRRPAQIATRFIAEYKFNGVAGGTKNLVEKITGELRSR